MPNSKSDIRSKYAPKHCNLDNITFSLHLLKFFNY